MASEHFYNTSNIALNIHSDMLCDISRKEWRLNLKGTGFSLKGTGFSLKGTGFSPYINRTK